jgi:hypothetical protein
VALGAVLLAGGVGYLAQDSRLLRVPVFMAVLSLAGGAGALAGGWHGARVARDSEKAGVVLCALAVSMSAWTIGYLHAPSDDYRLYELAARQWIAGQSFYSVQGHNQLPLPLLSIAALRIGVTQMAGSADPDRLWQLTYYAYELGQLLSSIAIIGGCYAVALAAGATRERAGVIAGVAVGLAFPIRESLGNNQMNLPVLALALPALASQGRYPWIAGALVSIGGALKLYPFALLMQWVADRRWRALSAAVLTGIALVVAMWPHWLDFASFVETTEPADAYRHVGLHAVVMNSTGPLLRMLGLAPSTAMATYAWLGSVGAVVAWTMWITFTEQRRPVDERRGVETAARVMGAVLLVFPLAWAHHFVFALPLAICVWSRGTPRQRHVIGTVLLLFVPAFDIYGFGLHRLTGLLLLLAR